MTNTILRSIEFDAAHRLPDHDGKCRRLHGHRYTVEVLIEGDVHPSGPERGMVLDFAKVDRVLKHEVIDAWDHMTLLWVDDPLCSKFTTDEGAAFGIVLLPCVPTAENIATLLCSRLVQRIGNLTAVRVWETPRSCAEATP